MSPARRRRPSIRALARRAQVSPSTVSRALRGKEGVSEETRSRLMRMASEMGLLKGPPRRTDRWAHPAPVLVLVDARTYPYMRNLAEFPFYMELISGLHESAEQAGALLEMMIVDDDAGIERAFSTVTDLPAARRAEGILWLGYEPLASYEPWVARSQDAVPVVLCDHYIPGLPWDAVVSDNVGGAFTAASHIAALGHRRVTLLPQDVASASTRERMVGFQAGLFAGGLTAADVQVRETPASYDGGYQAFDSIMEWGSTAVLCGDDMSAMGVLRRAQEEGLAVPKDLSVAGFDDLAMGEQITPALTTVHVDKRALGQAALRLLLARIRERREHGRPAASRPAGVRTLVPTRLVVRESTGPAPDRPA